MNIETVNENINTSKMVCNEKKPFKVEGEINVPDIKPDILNLANVYADAFISNTEIMENKVKVVGSVDTYLIYHADDEDGSVRGITTSFPFTEYIDVNGINENSFVNVESDIIGVDAKVINSRKIDVKVTGFLHIVVSQKANCSVTNNVSGDDSIEIKKENFIIKTLDDCKKETVSINETVSLGEENKPIGEIIKASIKLLDGDYKTSYNKILTKTEALVKIIYVADDEISSIQSFETRIPVMGFIDIEGLDDQTSVYLKYSINGFSVKPVYQDMKATSFVINSEICINALIYKILSLNIVSDLYSTSKSINQNFKEVSILENKINEIRNIELSHSLLIPELDMIKILDVNAKALISNIELLDEKIALEGNVEFDILFYRLDKKIIESKKMELPFAQVEKIAGLNSTMKPQIDVMIDEIKYKVIGQNQLQIDLNMKVSIVDFQNKVIKFIDGVEEINEEMKTLPSLAIYYVKVGDTLWNIAKMFRTTVNMLMEINELKDDMIYPGQQIIIPKYRKLEEVSTML